MQTINLDEIQAKIQAQQGGCAPTLGGNSTRSLPRELVAMVWQLMSSLYGHKWVSSYGAEVDPDRVWGATLSGLSEPQVRQGMRQCVDQALEWPPSAPEFRRLCTGGAPHWEHARVAAADREYQGKHLLINHAGTESARDAGRRELNRMRSIMGMGPKQQPEAA